MGRSNDFKFWEEKVSEDQLVTAYSPPLWTKPTNLRPKNSPLLPHKHHYSSLSPTSQLKSIVHSRNVLTEMIKNIQESSYELSLKDIVDDHQNIEEVQEKKLAEKEKNVKLQKIKYHRRVKRASVSKYAEVKAWRVKSSY